MYKIKYEVQPNNPNLTLEEPMSIFTYDTKKEAHLIWLNMPRQFVSINVMFDETKKDRYKIFTNNNIREVIDINNNSVQIRMTKLY